MRLLVVIAALLVSLNLWSQENDSIAVDWQEAFRQWTDVEDVESDSWEALFDELSERADQPINLNQATREDLEQLPFLTAQQVEELVAYLYRYGPIRSLGELRMITSLDPERRRLLAHFIVLGETAPKQTPLRIDSIWRQGRQQVMLTAKVPFYERKGDRNGYLGYRYRHTLRYQFNYRDRIKFGLTAAQDAGEPFFANKNRWGYDHYSYYFQLKDFGRLQNLCVGMYRVQLGMGLVMNSSFNLGKLAILESMGRAATTLRPYSSRSAADYLQGVAATMRITDYWQVTAFASYRPLDATLNDDGSARTLIKDGYHRTPTELSKKNNTHETDLGGSIKWRKGSLYVAANIVYTHLDRELRPQKENAVYRRFAPEGHSFLNVSADYGYTNAKLSVSGEIALNRQGALASIHKLNYRLSDQLTAMTLYRFYSRRYTSLHSRSFCEGTGTQNEHGIYAGLTWQPRRSLILDWYADYAHFGWPRYLVSLPSDAFDTMLRTRYTFRKWSFEGRYRLHIRQRDNQEKTMLINRTEHRARLRATLEAMPSLTLQTQLDGVIVSYKQQSRGWMLAQQAVWKYRSIQLAANVGYFHTDDYESRLYQYERSVLYNFNFPMYYGQGIRYAILGRADIGRHLMLIAKLGVTNYFDRPVISSGLQQVDGSSLCDLDVQLRYKF